MGVTPIYKWPFPEDTDVANSNLGFGELAKAVEKEFADTSWIAYVPEWRAAGSQQPANATILAWYKTHRGWCDVYIAMSFGSSVSGGRGVLTLSVPVAAEVHMLSQFLFCKTWKSSWGGQYHGIARIVGGTNLLRPIFPIDATTTRMAPWQSANTAGTAGTGVPAVASAFTVANGVNLTVAGRFKHSG